MSDLIDRSQEIGSKFLAWTPETGPCPISINDHYWFKKLCALFEKQAALEAQLAALTEQTRWIPVGERLPECGEYVLINANGATFIAYHILSIQQWSAAEGVYFCRDAYKSVTHWMPLPEAPKEEE